MLVIWNRRDISFPIKSSSSCAVGIQRFQRRGSSFFDCSPKLLYRSQRFSQLVTHIGRGVLKRFQHIFLAAGLNLLTDENLPAGTVDGIQPDHIVVTESGD